MGIAAYVVSQMSGPKSGSIEYHKREYLAAWKRLNNRETFVDKGKQLLYRFARRKAATFNWTAEDAERLQNHRAALLRSGQLSQQGFELTNSSIGQVCSSSEYRSAMHRCHREFLTVVMASTNMLHIIALPEDLVRFAEAIRKADMPESGN